MAVAVIQVLSHKNCYILILSQEGLIFISTKQWYITIEDENRVRLYCKISEKLDKNTIINIISMQ